VRSAAATSWPRARRSAALDLERGGALAADLRKLYSYVALRLTHANLHNDEAALEECVRLIETLHSGWAAIADRAGA
jgi:flagellar protein FliS